MKEIIYLAHPVSGDPVGNAHKAIGWLRFLVLADPDRIYIAPWIAEVLAFQDDIVDTDQLFYDRVLSDDCEIVRRCDGILLVGGMISRGMALEAEAAMSSDRRVIDWHQFVSPADMSPADLLWWSASAMTARAANV